MKMGFLNRFGAQRDVPVVEDPAQQYNSEKAQESGVTNQDAPVTKDEASESDVDAIDKDAQAGVQKVEAMTKVWTRSNIIMAYVFIWIIYFVDSLQQGMGFALLPYVTSSFQQHSLTAVTGIFSQLIGGVSKLTLAKILDVWGRPQGYLVTVVLMTLGLITMAACNNVETFAAAQVFYWVGYNGISYVMSVFIADTSALKNRGIMLAFISSPYVITVWITGPLATSVLTTVGWRWGYGIFAIITPIATLPLFFLFTSNVRKAEKQGLLVKKDSGRTLWESIKYYFWEFDIICLILVSGGFSLFLLPFSIYSYQTYGWRDPLTIALIIVGGVLLIAAAFWEKYYAPIKFLPWELLTDRTVIGACCLAAILFIEYYIWTSYFSSFLQVVLNLELTPTTYIGNIYTLGSCFFSFIVGILIRQTGRFKWIAMYFGVPITILAVGLLIKFREPNTSVGLIVLAEILYAFAGGACVICEQIAVMAAASHQHIAVVLAVEGMFSSVGGAIGLTISSAIWTGVFPVKLAEYLPPESQGNLAAIYEDLVVQLSYPPGTPTREAISQAYADAQKWMLVAATAITGLGLVAVAVWRDISVKNFKQVKGRVV